MTIKPTHQIMLFMRFLLECRFIWKRTSHSSVHLTTIVPSVEMVFCSATHIAILESLIRFSHASFRSEAARANKYVSHIKVRRWSKAADGETTREIRKICALGKRLLFTSGCQAR